MGIITKITTVISTDVIKKSFLCINKSDFTMKRIISILCICIAAIVCARETVGTGHEFPKTIVPGEDLPEMDLFLCIGQSNMAGRGTLDETKGDLEPLEGVYLLDKDGNMVPATNPMNQYSSVRKEISMQQMSPAYSFAKKIVAETGHAVGLVVNARGGTAIESWDPDEGNGDTLYSAAVRRAKQAMRYGKFKAVIWHQGEANSAPEKVEKYPGQLKEMVESLREDLGDPDLYFVAGELAPWFTTDAFKDMIGTISDFIDENADYVSAEGLTPLIDESDPHFDRESQLTLGERYADKVLEHVYGI